MPNEASAASKTLSYTGYKQEKTYWCWAATIKTCAAKKSAYPSQSTICRYVKGSVTDSSATSAEVKKGLQYYCGTTYLSTTTTGTISYSSFVADLNRGSLIAFGYKSHMVTVYGYNNDSGNKLRAYDPQTGTASLKLHSAYSTQKCKLSYKV